MKKFIFFFGFFLTLFNANLYAQNTTTITGTIIDSDSQPWANATWTARINVPGGGEARYISGGGRVPTSFTGILTSAGSFSSASVGNNSAIVPYGTSWVFTFCTVTSSPCQTVQPPLSITGSTQNISVYINAAIIAPRINSGTIKYAYNTTEIVNPSNGDSYTNSISGCTFIWTSSWVASPCGGGSIPATLNLLKGNNSGGASSTQISTDSATQSNLNVPSKLTSGIAFGAPTASGQTSISNAITVCAAAYCHVLVDPAYTGSEKVPTVVTYPIAVNDERYGQSINYFNNWDQNSATIPQPYTNAANIVSAYDQSVADWIDIPPGGQGYTPRYAWNIDGDFQSPGYSNGPIGNDFAQGWQLEHGGDINVNFLGNGIHQGLGVNIWDPAGNDVQGLNINVTGASSFDTNSDEGIDGIRLTVSGQSNFYSSTVTPDSTRPASFAATSILTACSSCASSNYKGSLLQATKQILYSPTSVYSGAVTAVSDSTTDYTPIVLTVTPAMSSSMLSTAAGITTSECAIKQTSTNTNETCTFTVSVTSGTFVSGALDSAGGFKFNQFRPSNVSTSGSVATITTSASEPIPVGAPIYQGNTTSNTSPTCTGTGVSYTANEINGLKFPMIVLGCTDTTHLQVAVFGRNGGRAYYYLPGNVLINSETVSAPASSIAGATFTANTVVNNAYLTISGITGTITPGTVVTGTNVPTGAFVVSVSGSLLQLSQNATGNGTGISMQSASLITLPNNSGSSNLGKFANGVSGNAGPKITIANSNNFNGLCYNSQINASGNQTCSNPSINTALTDSSNAVITLGDTGYGNSDINLYSVANVLDVRSPVNGLVDGSFVLSDNQINFTSGAAVSMGQMVQQNYNGITTGVNNPTPFSTNANGITVAQNSMYGSGAPANYTNASSFAAINNTPSNSYIYGGGTQSPGVAHETQGIYTADYFATDPPWIGGILLGANCTNYCNDPNYSYNWLNLGGNTSQASIVGAFYPYSGTYNIQTIGPSHYNSFQLSPAGFQLQSYVGGYDAFTLSGTGANNSGTLSAGHLIDNSLTVNTSPICANGAGGEFTNVGCTSSLGGTLSNANASLGSGAGTGATVTLTGLDGSHNIAIQTGTGAAANGTVVTVTFTASRGHTSYCTFTPANSVTGLAAGFQTFPASPSANSYVLQAIGTLTAATTISYNVNCP